MLAKSKRLFLHVHLKLCELGKRHFRWQSDLDPGAYLGGGAIGPWPPFGSPG